MSILKTNIFLHPVIVFAFIKCGLLSLLKSLFKYSSKVMNVSLQKVSKLIRLTGELSVSVRLLPESMKLLMFTELRLYVSMVEYICVDEIIFDLIHFTSFRQINVEVIAIVNTGKRL